MTPRPSVVIWGGPPFFGPANSVQSEMARALRSLGCRVLYIELGGDPAAFREALSRRAEPPRDPALGGTAMQRRVALSAEGIAVARAPRVPFLPYAMLGAPAAVNLRLAGLQLRKLRALWAAPEAPPSPPGRTAVEAETRPVVVHYGWFSARLARAFPEARHVLDCIDEHTAAEEVIGHARRLARVRREEARLLRACELVVCVSRRLAARRRELARRVVVLPNGADPSAFEGASAEEDRLRAVPRPRVLFLGRIGPKVDLELLLAAAREESAPGFVLAGEWTVPVPRSLPPNVLALGRVSRGEVPAIAAGCDAAVAPLRLTEWNLSSSPMKLGDYLAAGLPFVSTRIPAAEEIARELPGAVFFADSPSELARAARAAASAGAELRARAREYAGAHSWRARARRLLEELGSPAGSSRPGPGGGRPSA